jgi:hypothetical protein
VSVGAHTVTEVNSTNFELDPNAPGNGITVLPPGNEISRSLANRSVTVNVPFAGDTTTTFFNRIRQFQVKICKYATAGSAEPLASVTFNYNWAVNLGMADRQGPAYLFPVGEGLHPGECAFVSDRDGNPVNFNVVTSAGVNAVVRVVEFANPPASVWNSNTPPPFGSVFVSKIQVFGSRNLGTANPPGTVPAPGVETDCQTATFPSPTGQICLFFPPFREHVGWNAGPGVNEADFYNTAGG